MPRSRSGDRRHPQKSEIELRNVTRTDEVQPRDPVQPPSVLRLGIGGKRLSLLSAAFLIGLVVITNATGVPLSGPRFVSLRPNHTIGLSGFGYSVALSADGSEALVSGVADNHQAGAVWAYKRNGRTWSETGQKLTGCESTNPTSGFGVSVAISGAGTTAIVGCPGFDHRDGAAAVFARTTGRWHQVGLLLLPSGEVSSARLGLSVSLSYNGRVAVVGGPIDSGPKTAKFVDGRGAVWIYVRKSSGWDQDGPKLTGAGESAIGDFGGSVGLSADGKTLIVGGANANNGRGGVWFFTRRPTGWVPVGGKHAGPAPRSLFGYAVALAGDGQVALVGVPRLSQRPGRSENLRPHSARLDRDQPIPQASPRTRTTTIRPQPRSHIQREPGICRRPHSRTPDGHCLNLRPRRDRLEPRSNG